MRVLISGASGLVGKHAVEHLRAAGHQVQTLVRATRTSAGEASAKAVRRGISWNPAPTDPWVDLEGLRSFNPQAVIHLSGANISGGRWSYAYMKELWDSRIKSARILGQALREAECDVEVALCASGVATFDKGESSQFGENAVSFTEKDAPNYEDDSTSAAVAVADDSSLESDVEFERAYSSEKPFLHELALGWEEAAKVHLAIRGQQTRVVSTRFGLILDPNEGVLPAMMPAFKFCLGAQFSDGQAWFSWVSLRDVMNGMELALTDDSIRGGLNLVAPNPVTNAELTSELARALHRPVFPVRVPAFVLQTAGGAAMGRKFIDETVLASIKVAPAALLERGFQFQDTQFGPTLDRVLAE